MKKNKIDIIEKKKRKKIQKSFLRLLVLMLIAAFCVFLYMERGNWISGVENRIESIRQNDGVLADGNFPLKVSDDGDYQLQVLDDRLALLSNSYLYIYSVRGENIDTRQVSYIKPVIKSNGDYSLCFENGGTGFRVDKADGVLYDRTADDLIITGAVSDIGYTALITASSTYSCSIYIYDSNGKKIYTRNCVERVNDISFDNDSKGCVFVQLSSEKGEISSVMRRVRFDTQDAVWETPSMSSLCMETSFTNDGRICVIGNNMCAYYNKKGQLESMYTYAGVLLSYHVQKGQAAVLIRSDETRETSLVLFDGSAEEPVSISVNQSASYVRVADGVAYLMSSDNIVSYAFNGNAVATVALDNAYERFIKLKEYLFLMSYDRIDRVNFDE
ncbi:MAG: hypothetical protein K2H01_05495 [Ruminococcus sp.]|nr:hypothetical protein [Ruminococcus sp.]